MIRLTSSTLLLATSLLILSNGPAHAGQWQIAVTGSGAAKATSSSAGPSSVSFTPPMCYVTGTNIPSPCYNKVSFGMGGGAVATSTLSAPVASCSDTASLNATVTGTWVPSFSGDKPPATMSFKEVTSATGQAIGLSYNSLASDCFSDAPTTSITGAGLIPFGMNAFVDSTISASPSELTPLSTGSGSFTLSRSFSASGNSTTSLLGTLTTSTTSLQYTGAVDNRVIAIIPPIAPTFHSSDPGGGRGTPIRNQPSGNVEYGDTVLPMPTTISFPAGIPSGGTSLGYSGSLSGNWAPNSTYLLHSSIGYNSLYTEGFSVSGTVTPTSGFGLTGTLTAFYFDGDGPVPFVPANISKGSVEHVYLHVTDAGDGSTATSNYYLNWHAQIENWLPHLKSTLTPQLDSTGPSSPAGTATALPCDLGSAAVSVAGTGVSGQLADSSRICVETAVYDPVLIDLASQQGLLFAVGAVPGHTTYSVDGNLSQFEADISTQQSIDAGRGDGEFPDPVNRLDGSVKAALISFTPQQVFGGAAGSLTFVPKLYYVSTRYAFDGDLFTTAGYSGKGTGAIDYPTTQLVVYTWTLG